MTKRNRGLKFGNAAIQDFFESRILSGSWFFTHVRANGNSNRYYTEYDRDTKVVKYTAEDGFVMEFELQVDLKFIKQYQGDGHAYNR